MRPKVRKGLHGRKGELSMNKKKLPLAFWIFIGLVVGIAVGLALMMVPNGLDIAKNYILPWGTIFLNLLKFIVVPIVLFLLGYFAVGALVSSEAARIALAGLGFLLGLALAVCYDRHLRKQGGLTFTIVRVF